MVDAWAEDLLGLGHCEHAAEAGLLRHAAEASLLPVGGVRGHPGQGEIGGQGAQYQAPGRLSLGGRGGRRPVQCGPPLPRAAVGDQSPWRCLPLAGLLDTPAAAAEPLPALRPVDQPIEAFPAWSEAGLTVSSMLTADGPWTAGEWTAWRPQRTGACCGPLTQLAADLPESVNRKLDFPGRVHQAVLIHHAWQVLHVTAGSGLPSAAAGDRALSPTVRAPLRSDQYAACLVRRFTGAALPVLTCP